MVRSYRAWHAQSKDPWAKRPGRQQRLAKECRLFGGGPRFVSGLGRLPSILDRAILTPPTGLAFDASPLSRLAGVEIFVSGWGLDSTPGERDSLLFSVHLGEEPIVTCGVAQ